MSSIKQVARINNFDLVNQKSIELYTKNQIVSPTLKYILSLRFPDHKQQKFIYDNVSDLPDKIKDIKEIKLEYLIEKFLTKPDNKTVLAEIKELYTNQPTIIYNRHLRYEREYNRIMPHKIAIEIMKDCREFPRALTSQAEKACRIYASKKIVPIGEISENNKWFRDS